MKLLMRSPSLQTAQPDERWKPLLLRPMSQYDGALFASYGSVLRNVLQILRGSDCVSPLVHAIQPVY